MANIEPIESTTITQNQYIVDIMADEVTHTCAKQRGQCAVIVFTVLYVVGETNRIK